LLDADGQHNPDEIPALTGPIQRGEADIVVGSRFLEERSNVPAYRRIGQEILTASTNITSGYKLTDSQSGFRAFGKKAINALKLEESSVGIESEMQLRAKELNLKIAEVPISCSYGADTSTYGPVYHGLTVLASIIRYVSQDRPLTFFGIPGAVSLLIGIYLGVDVIYKFNMNNVLPTGTALLTAIFILAGIFSLFTGIILYTIGNQISKLKKE